MHVVADVALVVVGVVAVFVVLDAALRTFVLPRGAPVLFTHLIFRSVRRALQLFARPSRSYEVARPRDGAVRAARVADVPRGRARRRSSARSRASSRRPRRTGWHDALLTSGSSLFTLGFERPAGLGSAFIAFTEAAIGLGLLAVLIAYLPDDLRLVLAPRGDGHAALGARRARRRPRGGRSSSRTVPATSTSSIRCGTSGCSGSRSSPRRTRRSARSRSSGRRTRNRSWITVGRHGARRRRAPAGGAEHPVHAGARALHPVRVPGAAGDRRLLRLRPRPRPVARRPDQRRPRGVHRDLRAARGRRASRCGPTASGRGATSRAGASTTTGCCSRCAAW